MAIISRFRDCPLFSDLASPCPASGRCSGTSSDISLPGRYAQNANVLMSSLPVLFRCGATVLYLYFRPQTTPLRLSYYAGPPTDDQVSSLQVSVPLVDCFSLTPFPLDYRGKRDDNHPLSTLVSPSPLPSFRHRPLLRVPGTTLPLPLEGQKR